MALAPGLSLGDQIELNLTGAIMTDNDPWLVFTRPISRGLLLAAAVSVVLAIWQHLRHQKRALDQDRLSKARSIEGIPPPPGPFPPHGRCNKAPAPTSSANARRETAGARTLPPGIGWPFFLLVWRRHAREELHPRTF